LAMYSWLLSSRPEHPNNICSMVDLRDIVYPLQALLVSSGVNVAVPYVMSDIAVEPLAPVLCKSRPVGSRNCATIKAMKMSKHWGPVAAVAEIDTPFDEKLPSAVWRGATSGQWTHDGVGGCSRQQLYLRWGTAETTSAVDVGLVFLHVYFPRPHDLVLKRDMPRAAMLRHRYQVSVEGNDVASNLKWVMASWSVPLMPRPRLETWLMEGLLEPYVHYVPLADDTADLEVQVAWCEAREGRCREVAEAGRRWMEMFGDAEAERGLEERVVRDFVARHARALAGRAAYVAMAEREARWWNWGGDACETAERLLEGLREEHGELGHLQGTLARWLGSWGEC